MSKAERQIDFFDYSSVLAIRTLKKVLIFGIKKLN